ncbi:hypothetical protein DVH05_003994 [Phytophthora capsici]|nr:hypothetical protein DVH05_003994 [Phytophthora capsici]
MSKLELFSYWQNSCSWRVRIALAWKGINYDYHPVDLRAAGGGQQRQAAFRKLNPNQRVPALVVDGYAMAQSGAILEYLEEAYSEKPLLPSGLFERAQVRNLCGIIGCDTQPAQSMGLSGKCNRSLTCSLLPVPRNTKRWLWLGTNSGLSVDLKPLRKN